MRSSFCRLLALSLLMVPGAALAQTAKPAPKAASGVTSRAASAVAITINKTIQGQFVTCPTALKVSKQAICLYSKDTATNVRTQAKSSLGTLALGDWKTAGQASSLLVSDTPGGTLAAYVLLSSLSATETLIIVDGVNIATTTTKPATPTGVIKGQPYLLGSDLAGVVNVISLGGGKYRLNAAGQTAITVTAGAKTAQRAGGSIDLPLAPATDGKNLIFPVAGLRALGCTVTDATKGVTIACGSDSIGVRPIIF